MSFQHAKALVLKTAFKADILPFNQRDTATMVQSLKLLRNRLAGLARDRRPHWSDQAQYYIGGVIDDRIRQMRKFIDFRSAWQSSAYGALERAAQRFSNAKRGRYATPPEVIPDLKKAAQACTSLINDIKRFL